MYVLVLKLDMLLLFLRLYISLHNIYNSFSIYICSFYEKVSYLYIFSLYICLHVSFLYMSLFHICFFFIHVSFLSCWCNFGLYNLSTNYIPLCIFSLYVSLCLYSTPHLCSNSLYVTLFPIYVLTLYISPYIYLYSMSVPCLYKFYILVSYFPIFYVYLYSIYFLFVFLFFVCLFSIYIFSMYVSSLYKFYILFLYISPLYI